VSLGVISLIAGLHRVPLPGELAPQSAFMFSFPFLGIARAQRKRRMDDKSALLNQLRIDRGSGPAPSGKGRIWLGAAAVIAGLAALAAWWWTSPGAIPVHVVTARAIAGDGAAGGSVLDASGYVVARRQATVASKITAKMVELDIEEGDHVKGGQIIAKLDDTNIRAALNQSRAQLAYAKAGLAETRVNLANAQRDYDRQNSLIAGHFVSQAAVDNSRTTLDALGAQLATQRTNIEVAERGVDMAERNLDDTIVRAPFSGVVTVKAAQPGEMVSPISAGGGFTRTGIGTIVDMESLEIQVDVNENFINRVRAAQQATAKLNAYPDWQIPAHVIAVIPTADRSKGTVTVRIALDQKDPRILPEMGVRVSFLADSPREPGAKPAAGVNLPSNAVQGSGDTGVVFLVHGDTVERRAVRLGARSSDGVTVLSGVAAGESVAVGDFTRLKDGVKIRVD
jgi:RND family efflux transporter MFP subunit